MVQMRFVISHIGLASCRREAGQLLAANQALKDTRQSYRV
jgi:hypothetical protein